MQKSSISTKLKSDNNSFKNRNKGKEEAGQLCVTGNLGKPRVIFFKVERINSWLKRVFKRRFPAISFPQRSL